MKEIGENKTMTDKRLTSKIRKGIADEKDGIKYYSSYTPKQKRELGETGTKHLQDAKKDEREHLGFLEQDLERVRPKQRRRP